MPRTFPRQATGEVILPGDINELQIALERSESGVANVLDYGAVGDGVANDATAFTNALAALPARGGMLVIPAGRYKLNATVTIPRATRVIGFAGPVWQTANSGVKIISGTLGMDVFKVDPGGSVIEHSGPLIENIAFEDIATGSTAIAVRMTNRWTVRNCTFTNFAKGIEMDSDATAYGGTVAGGDCAWWMIDQCLLQGNTIGIDSISNYGGTILGGEFTGGTTAVKLYNSSAVRILGAHFDGATTQLDIIGSQNQAIGCKFEKPTTYGVRVGNALNGASQRSQGNHIIGCGFTGTASNDARTAIQLDTYADSTYVQARYSNIQTKLVEQPSNADAFGTVVIANDGAHLYIRPYVNTTGAIQGKRPTSASTGKFLDWLHSDGTVLFDVSAGGIVSGLVAVASKTAAYTAVKADELLLCDATTAAFTVTLPSASAVGISGKEYTIKKTDSSANAVTVDGNGAQTIDGAATKALGSQHAAINIVSDGANWRIAAQMGTVTLMATYYVRKTGSDANAGTSAALAWLTIDKALGATGIASGDVVYIGAGTYREAVLVAMVSATVETRIVGDVDGAQTGDAGPVIWTAYLTDDVTAPSANATVNLSQRDFLTFENLLLIGGTGMVVRADTAGSVNVTLRDCALIAPATGNPAVSVTSTGAVALNWTFDRCRFLSVQRAITVTLSTDTVADYDANVQIKNCFMLAVGVGNVLISATGAGAFKGGGVDIRYCTIIGADSLVATNSANVATSIPSTVEDCLLINGSNKTGLTANTLGQITEDRNLIYALTPRTNVTAGGASSSDISRAPLWHIGYESVVGQALRPFLAPMPGSPLLGFGSLTGAPTVDLLNRPRPAGGSITPAAGALERHDSGVLQSTVAETNQALQIAGPGDHEFKVAVAAVATTITVRGRYDTNHGTTNKPQLLLLADGEIGVAAQTITMTAAVDAWATLTVTFTPTRAGVATLRLVSRSAATTGNAYFDTWTVT